jgi:hypothetical protein
LKVDEIAQKGFALHQTFPPRFGWLKKAYDIASADGKIFSDEEATVKLGVGKNMVDAIAFWAQAFRILDVEKSAKKKEASRFIPTSFGTLMFDEEIGLDPYLEIPHSLWLLHWMSLQPTTKVPTWWLAFSEFGRTEFSADDLVEFVYETVLVTSWKYDNRKAVLRDVDCLLRMYSPRLKKSRLTVDDYLDSPFRDLGIIGPSSLNKGEYRFQLGDKPNLDAKLVVLACIHFMSQMHTASSTVPHLLNDSGAPGKVFRLTESSLTSYLHEGVLGIKGIKIATPAGVTQLVIEGELLDVASQLLSSLYSADLSSGFLSELVSQTFVTAVVDDVSDDARVDEPAPLTAGKVATARPRKTEDEKPLVSKKVKAVKKSSTSKRSPEKRTNEKIASKAKKSVGPVKKVNDVSTKKKAVRKSR